MQPDVCFRRRVGCLETRTGSCPDSEASSYSNPASSNRGEGEISFQRIHYSSPADESYEIEPYSVTGPRRRSCWPFAFGSRNELYWARRILGGLGCWPPSAVYGAAGSIQTTAESDGFRGGSLSGGSFGRRASLRTRGTMCSSSRSPWCPPRSVF